MSPTTEITRKSAGPEGAAISADQPPAPPWASFKVHLTSFMLEDYVDAVEARAALNDPDNAERVPWEQLRGHLGL